MSRQKDELTEDESWRVIIFLSIHFSVEMKLVRCKKDELSRRELSVCLYPCAAAPSWHWSVSVRDFQKALRRIGVILGSSPICGGNEVTDTERTNDAAAAREMCEEELTAEYAEDAEK